jgi:primosomal protein N' (replication factor Y)
VQTAAPFGWFITHDQSRIGAVKIARIVVDLALNKEFDYLVPEALEGVLGEGDQVIVPFGPGTKRGYVTGFADHSAHKNLKAIRERVGHKRMVEDHILRLARWMADYYLTPIELCLKAVLPAAVRKNGPAFKQRLLATVTAAGRDPATLARVRAKSAKQAAVLDAVLAGGPTFVHALIKAAGATNETVRALERKGLLVVGISAEYRDPNANVELLSTQPLPLMEQQRAALARVKVSMDTLKPPVILLHGVTGSGKTEIYLQAIAHGLTQGKGAIVLVPEIALTPQTVERFRGRFGEVIAVLHSSLSQGERHDEWHRVHDGSARIVIGARSALFAPVRQLGLIVVDEEHEPTYKQEESPRYHARDMAVLRGSMEKCAVLLGSATPALESLHNAQCGKYELVSMPARVDHRQMPAMRVVDLRAERAREGKLNIFSRDLVTAIGDRLHRQEQVILFHNRRGYSTSLVCPKCGHVAQCDQCSVSMTYHKPGQCLLCHICGARQPVPSACPNPDCRDPAFRYAGLGTQRIEELVARLFPKAQVKRMDSDTMTDKHAYRKALGDFRSGATDILLGTQMIAKGLDFPNVTLVGVINADLSLHISDFRAGERTFQLLTQVAGRAGRGDVRGEVIVQTFTPFHPAIQAARQLDFTGFCEQEMEFRRELSYPPFAHLVCLTLRGVVEERVKFAGETFLKALAPKLDAAVVVGAPAPAPLARAEGRHRYQILLRAPRTVQITRPLRDELAAFRWPEDVECLVDVDPQSLS